ncbi:complement C1q tumor necrosis factor-related protein 3-like [Dreissena polymorpha]|uniref:C1q domain-containing protein n=1 Tax=Dreissena polymorpha TaxID=45954 RepID=A0A9D4L4S8_DREPO|nr:complement C1q tumor necrosis factor-related protein 3-like [Dreissena polymorpha]KAH3851283.1 hypothetical protein DPMN_093763 [Dreissena polymorpha]
MNTLVCMTLCLHVLSVMGQPAMEQPAESDYDELAEADSKSLQNTLVALQKSTRLSRQRWVNALKKKDGSCKNCRNSATVAFTALLNKPKENIGRGQKIIFQNVVLNKGGAYNPRTGVFTAPVTGLYLFSATLLHEPERGSLHAALVHSGRRVALLHATSGMWDEGSQTVIIQVNKGEQVWIQNKNGYNSLIYGMGFSSFAGVLLG